VGGGGGEENSPPPGYLPTRHFYPYAIKGKWKIHNEFYNFVEEAKQLADNYCQTQQTIYYKNTQILHNYAPCFSYTKN